MWILVDTWRLIDTRVSARQDPARDQGIIQRLSREIKVSLQVDHRRQEEASGINIEAILASDPPLHK